MKNNFIQVKYLALLTCQVSVPGSRHQPGSKTRPNGFFSEWNQFHPMRGSALVNDKTSVLPPIDH